MLFPFFHDQQFCKEEWGVEGAPTGIRTPVLALKGPRPRPLDDGSERKAQNALDKLRRLAPFALGVLTDSHHVKKLLFFLHNNVLVLTKACC